MILTKIPVFQKVISHAASLIAVVSTGILISAPYEVGAAETQKLDLVDRVNVFTGTSNSRWMVGPGASMPFGMIKLGPDNQGNSWNGGYEYTVASISGFSHLHAMALSGLSIMPVTGPLQADPSSSRMHPGQPDGPFNGMWTAGYRSRFHKETEKGSPGYYSVELMDYKVKAELSATERCGYLRFTYPETDLAHLLINFDFPTEERNEILNAEFRRTGPTEFTGHVRQQNGYAGIHDVFYVIQLTKAPTESRIWINGEYKGTDTNYGIDWRRSCKILPLGDGFNGGPRSGAILTFSTNEGEKILVRTGISFVSEANARLNLETETKPFDWNFDAVVGHARNVWNELLGRIEVSDENPARTDIFYTCLYRVYTGKSKLNDVNGEFVDANGQRAHVQAPADAVYSSDGYWGIQWNLVPLWTMSSPDLALSMINSLLTLQERGGWIPSAPVALKYAPIMGAQHQNSLIVSAYQKGLRGFDVERAYSAMRHDYTTQGQEFPNKGFAGNRHLAAYMKFGYVPDEVGATSNTLEYAYDDWCMSQFAAALGREEDRALFAKRSENWRNVFDPSVGYVRRRHSDGTWVTNFDAHAFGTEGGWNGPGFMEGNAWIYTFFVPQNLSGLVDTMGRAEFNRRLSEGFEKGYVDMTNEPNLQAPFLFNYSGQPWLTQKYTRNAVAHGYDTSPYQGWSGEEDEGQLTAYFILLSTGLFEMDGGCAVEPYYDLTSPAFREIIFHLDPKYYPGGKFIVESDAANDQAVYIQSAELNGKPLTTSRLMHRDFAAGGTLHFKLGEVPNKEWGTTK